MERILNAQLEAESEAERNAGKRVGKRGGKGAVQFVLTDLHPHLEAWRAAAAKSENLTFVAEAVDAARAPRGLLGEGEVEKKVFRLFNLAFHHFDDGLAAEILRNTLETADGFGLVISSFFFPLALCSMLRDFGKDGAEQWVGFSNSNRETRRRL